MKKIKITLLVFILSIGIFVTKSYGQTITKTVGTTGADYATLSAAFTAIYDGNIDNDNGYGMADVVLQIIDNITESQSAVLMPDVGNGNFLYNSVTIYPTVSGKSVTGNFLGSLIELNGATSVTIDGRVNQTGSLDLTIENTNSGNQTLNPASTIKFVNSASDNIIKYCNIKGNEASTESGVILFSTVASGSGNDDNLIDYNNITESTSSRPVFAIYSVGTSGSENSGNSISNNNFYNCFNTAVSSSMIKVGAYSSSFTISSNSFYETSTFNPVSSSLDYIAIQIENSGTGFTVSNNYIGGQSALCGGSPLNKSNSDNPFYAIYLSVGTGTASNVQNNTIKNIAWSNSGSSLWSGVHILAGDVNIGTTSGNTIGATTGTGSINITGCLTGTNVYGLYTQSTGTIDCQNNNIGSITVGNSSTNASNFYGIYKSSAVGTTTISNNVIGSTTTANSINSSSISSANAQIVNGIHNLGTGTININSNTIANLTNSTTNSITTTYGLMHGINSSAGSNTISDNNIYNLKSSNANNSYKTASVCGISASGVTLKNMARNTIYNLSNTYSSFSGWVEGIYFIAGTSSTNTVSENFIHSLSVTGGSSTSANICGIRIGNGATTYSNNIINLGGSSLTAIYGIYEYGFPGNNNNIYHNSIYISGSVASGTNKSYALYSQVTANTRDFRNNIFYNARSTTSGSSLHYAMWVNYIGGTLTCDYNDYFASGTGGVLGYYEGNKTSLPIVTGQDANSLNVDPSFYSAGSTTATNYKIKDDRLAGVSTTGIADDYGSVSRTTYTMGAWENNNKWKGSTDDDWNTASNWTESYVPLTDANITFDDAPANHCLLDQVRSVTNITNAQSTHRMTANGHKLTVKGSLNFSNGAQIDASASSSNIEFAGSTAQSIPSGCFYNDDVYDLTVNNSSNVTLNGTLSLLNTMTASAGKLDAYSGSPTVKYSGTSGQTIGSTYLSDRIYNLTINNAAGVTVSGTTLNIDNTLQFDAGLLTTSASDYINLKAGAPAVVGAETGKYINGYCRKTGNTAFTFPVGNNGEYAPIGISAADGGGNATDYFTANYINAMSHPTYDSSLHVSSINHISKMEYWVLDRSGTNNVKTTLSWDTRSGGVTVLANLTVARWDGSESEWKDHGNGATTGNTSAGTIQSSDIISCFTTGVFTLASKTGDNPLPIELLSFTGEYKNGVGILNWTTAIEINNDYFTVEKSSDMTEWSTLTTINGAGNSNIQNYYSTEDQNMFEGINYYRLKQTDFNGGFKYNNTIAVTAINTLSISQPFFNNSELEFVIYDSPGLNKIRIINSLGSIVYSTEIFVENNYSKININVGTIHQGIYMFSVSNSTEQTVKKIIF